MEDSCFQNCPLSSWSGGKVFKKAVRLFKNKTKQNKMSSLSYRLGLRQECLPELYKLRNNERKIN